MEGNLPQARTKRGGDRRPKEVIEAEDARWNRIFSRFVDPEYYAPRVPSLQSSFGAFAGRMELLCRG